MRIRNVVRKRTYGERESVVAYIHGIDPNGDVVHVLVHQCGINVRFSSQLGDHAVGSRNAADLEKWMREAESVLGLVEVFGVPRGWMQAPENMEKLDLLNKRAAEKKRELAA